MLIGTGANRYETPPERYGSVPGHIRALFHPPSCKIAAVEENVILTFTMLGARNEIETRTAFAKSRVLSCLPLPVATPRVRAEAEKSTSTAVKVKPRSAPRGLPRRPALRCLPSWESLPSALLYRAAEAAAEASPHATARQGRSGQPSTITATRGRLPTRPWHTAGSIIRVATSTLSPPGYPAPSPSRRTVSTRRVHRHSSELRYSRRSSPHPVQRIARTT